MHRIRQFLFVFFLFGSVVTAQQDDGKRKIVPRPFSSLTPEEIRQAVLEADRKLEEEFIRDAELENLRKSVPANTMLNLILENPSAFGDVELVSEQIDKLKEIKEKYTAQLTELLGEDSPIKKTEFFTADRAARMKLDPKVRSKYYRILDECHKAVLDVFLIEQLEGFQNTRIEWAGLSKVVTRSAVGNVLDLTDQQKQEIQEESNRIAREIEEFTKRIRQRSADAVLKKLTPTQREKLYGIYGKKNIKEYLSTATFLQLHFRNTFREQLPGEKEHDPPKLRTLRVTEVKLPDEK